MIPEIVNPKYQDILKSARELFWKYGFRRVTIEEICKNAKASKMTYYKFFPNKIELAKTVFRNVVEEGQDNFNKLMNEDLPVSEKIKKLIQFKVEATNNISREFLQDFYLGTEPELQTFVEQITTEAWNELLKDYRDAQQKGIFRNDFRPEFLLHVTFKLVELLKDEKVTKLYNSPQDLIIEFANLIAYGISPHQ